VNIDELITKNKIEILESERELENIHEISEYFSVEKFNIVKVMILRNKYTEKLVACAFTGGSRVDRRTLVDLDEGGTKLGYMYRMMILKEYVVIQLVV